MEIEGIKRRILEDVDPELRRRKKREQRKTRLIIALQYLGIIGFVMFVFYLLMGMSTVEGDSMYPTLQDENLAIYYRMNKQYRAGDVVVIEMPEQEEYVKRVVAVAGDTVNIQSGRLYVNGEEKQFAGTIGETNRTGQDVVYPVKVKDDEVFVLGDNRENSKDSRVFGVVKTENIKGRIIWYIGRL